MQDDENLGVMEGFEGLVTYMDEKKEWYLQQDETNYQKTKQ